MQRAATECWYAVRVRSNQEKNVHASLQGKGFETFLPLYRRVSRWSDRSKRIESPLFPGYVFARFDAVRRLPVLITAGVVQILGNAGGPLPVDEAELDAVRRTVALTDAIEPHDFLAAGDIIQVEHGPLAGLKGVLLRVKDDFRLVLSLTLLQRSVSVELDRDVVRLASSARVGQCV